MKNLIVFMLVFGTTLLMNIACNAQQQNKELKNTKNNSKTQTTETTATPTVEDNAVNTKSGEFNYGYMVLPGFTPIGKPEIDDMNYAKAKKEFVAQFPDNYIQKMAEMTETAKAEWMSKQTPTNSIKDTNVINIPRSRFESMNEAEQKRITENPQQFNIVD